VTDELIEIVHSEQNEESILQRSSIIDITGRTECSFHYAFGVYMICNLKNHRLGKSETIYFLLHPRPELYNSSDSIARPGGLSEEGKGVCPATASRRLEVPKNTSGLVQVATARLI